MKWTFLTALILFAGCAPRVPTVSEDHSGPLSSWSKFVLDDDMLASNRAAAEAGDPVAAMALANHFGAVGSNDEQLEWLRKADKLGDVAANERLVATQLSQGRCEGAQKIYAAFIEHHEAPAAYRDKTDRRITECRANPIGSGSWMERNPDDR